MLSAVVLSVAVPAQVRLKPNLILSRSSSIAKAMYRIPAAEDLKTPAIRITGDNITVDFHGAILEGTPQTVEPDQRKGLGILVKGKNVTIENLTIRGYKVALMGRNCPGLKILDSNFSYNWKQHLGSTIEKEDESDWQSYHHNEHDEWLRYGAGMYLYGCTGFEVKGCKAVGGQCGLMMTKCDKGLVWNNDFSFLTGEGIGMYRSSHNRIMNNKVDWCVRGFSYGVYNRGQDSAGILVFEQCDDNVFAYNSVTHGGDGFFLWAGQQTMDTGEGGCNGNLLYGNDFSHSPANGIESTFSKNDFVNNLMLECWHGIWGGYSYENHVLGNVFGHNDEAIAWEHGQDNVVKFNTFFNDNVGVHIWGGPADPNFVFAQKRDTNSKNWTISYNRFRNEFSAAVEASQTNGIAFNHNQLAHNGKDLNAGEKVEGVSDAANHVVEGKPAPLTSSLHEGPFSTVQDYLSRFKTDWSPIYYNGQRIGFDDQSGIHEVESYAPKPLKGAQNAFLKPGVLRGWRYILVDEWGPYDFQRPILWPRAADDPAARTKRFEILGPKGTWKVVSASGVERLSAKSGSVPGFLDVTIPAGKASNLKVTLQYRGGATTDYRGIVTPAGKPVLFGYSKFFAPIDWTIHFYKWSKSSDASDPHSVPDPDALKTILQGPALKELHSDRLDFAGSSFDPVTGNDHFITAADGTFTIQPGDYVLDMTCDDGARLWLDGKPLIQDAWHYQGPTLYSRNVHLKAGRHTIRVEHFQIDGYAMLKVNLRPKK